MAEVYVARSASLGGINRTCVIKRILPEYSNNRQFVSMFIDEARILIGLHHPNVVRLYDFGQVDGSYFMALEYVHGCNLVNILQNLFVAGHAMDPLALAYVAREMCEGLHHAHIQQDAQGTPLGIVHRDVSPHNVLISGDGDVKVADFGIAQARNKMTLTLPGTVMGKFAYMAPEQAIGQKVDARADLFALAVVMHEALAGSRLFSAATPAETMMKVVHFEPMPPGKIRPGVPPNLDAVVMRALSKAPHNRFANAADMAAALTTVLDDGGYTLARFVSYVREHAGAEMPAVEGSSSSSALKAEKGHTQRQFVVNAPAPVPRAITLPDVPARTKSRTGVGAALDPSLDPVVEQLTTSLSREPNLWTLAALGARHKDQGRKELAASAFRVAAAAFAYRRLIIQALVAHDRAGPLISEKQWEEDIKALSTLMLGDHAALTRYMAGVDKGGFFPLLQQADPNAYSPHEDKTPHQRIIPLFGAVPAENLVHLMRCTRVRHYAPGTQVIHEGDAGDTLYAIGEGRVVVFCNPPAGTHVEGGRIYLSSLSEGDFFGEFGFLVGDARSASVEAVLDTWVLEVDRKDVKGLIGQHPAMNGPLMDFYKARVVELLMAKNPVFAPLPPNERRLLLGRAQLQKFEDNELIIEEGGDGDAFYFIKQGEVEVFTEKDGIPIFINKLKDGEFFGEMAAVKGTRRTASVRSMSDVEVLAISRVDLEEVLKMQPELRTALEKSINARSQQTEEQVRSTTELLRLL
jgi:serine/threonine protein kinase/CRP-like cAMP-binding protein